jgi:type II secretory pathway pseudopilin PulG
MHGARRQHRRAHLGQRRAGFFLIEAIFGLTILGVVATLLLVCVQRERVAANRLAEHRAAAYRAEATLLAMQTNQPINKDNTIAIDRLPDPASAGLIWVRVTAVAHRQPVSLVGTVPAAVASNLNPGPEQSR